MKADRSIHQRSSIQPDSKEICKNCKIFFSLNCCFGKYVFFNYNVSLILTCIGYVIIFKLINVLISNIVSIISYNPYKQKLLSSQWLRTTGLHCNKKGREKTPSTINQGRMSNRWMDKGVVLFNGVLLSHKKEWNNAICSNMDGPIDYCTKWSKLDKYYMILIVCGIWKMTQLNYSQNRLIGLENKIMVTKRERWGKGSIRRLGLTYTHWI